MFGIEGLTGTLTFSIFVAAFGGAFQHGYNGGVVNAPRAVIEEWIRHTAKDATMSDAAREAHAIFIFSTIVSIYCLGGMVGGFSTHLWSRIFGRKWGIVWNNVLVFISAAFMAMSKSSNSTAMLIIGRFIIGINNGLSGGIVPMYLSEIPPISLRGSMGSIYQLILTISILIAQLVSNGSVLGNEHNWPTMFGLIVIPALIQMLLLPLCADSPRYLQERGRDDETKKSLTWLRGTDNVDSELDIIKKEVESDKAVGSVSFLDLFSIDYLRAPLIISCLIMMAQQFSGINAVIFYSTSTFTVANLSQSTAQMGTIAIGVMNVLMTIISTLIVDKAGRKTLLVIGFGLMFIDTLILCACLVAAQKFSSLAAAYASIAFVILFVVLFAVGPGSIPWFLVAELFMTNSRQKAASIAVAVNWISNYIVSLTFPFLQQKLEAYVFLIFAALQLFFVSYIILKVPETKNRPIEEITEGFKKKET